MLDLIYELLVEHVTSSWTTPLEVRETLDKWLEDPGNLPKSARARVARQAKVEARERAAQGWALTPEVRAAGRAAMDLAGGPAVPIKKL